MIITPPGHRVRDRHQNFTTGQIWPIWDGHIRGVLENRIWGHMGRISGAAAGHICHMAPVRDCAGVVLSAACVRRRWRRDTSCRVRLRERPGTWRPCRRGGQLTPKAMFRHGAIHEHDSARGSTVALWHTAGLLMRYGLHARDAAHEGPARQSRDRTPRTRVRGRSTRDMAKICVPYGHIWDTYQGSGASHIC